MKIIDLEPRYYRTYFSCLEDWSSEMDDAGNAKQLWFETYEKRGLRVKLAQDEEDRIVGMVQYIPIEESYVEGKDLYFIYCLWVHAYKEGVGDHRKKGIGKMLLKAAEEDARSLGASGICAWGVRIPVFMRSKWFKRNGYEVADYDGVAELVWKPFVENAQAPKWMKVKKKPEKVDGKVAVTAFVNGWCPAQNISFERAKAVASEFGDRVELRIIDTTSRDALSQWGICDSIYINDKLITKGPPLKREKIRRLLTKAVKRL